MSKFEIGDRVRVLETNCSAVNKGDIGKIKETRSYGNTIDLYLVEMENPQSGFEDGIWQFVDRHLELVESSVDPARILTLPTDSTERKSYPLFRGCLRYFPAALAGVARTSKLGNDKHNPGQQLYHARGKSMDHGDCILRHLTDVEDLLAASDRGASHITPQQILDEVNQMVWRALAYSQELHEKLGAPLAPGASNE